ncbi:MAG: IS30 family transposase [Pseudolabrys sp.]
MPHQLTLEERDRIAHLRSRGANQKDIAAALDRAPSTISRELDRNRTGDDYYPAQAQQAAQRRRRERPLARKMDDPAINEFVRDSLAHEWSPEQITGRLEQQYPDESGRRVSAQTIYAWIERDDDREHWQSFLRRRGKRPYRRKPAESAGGARIADRPEIIEQRMRLGDFEGDTVLGPPGTGGLATLVDRKSRFTIVLKVQSKHADHVHQRLKDRLKELEAERRRSITFDNGTEFARCDRLEKHLGIKLYYADPGCPYQRGSNENTNGLIRQYFPKGTDFRDISHHEVRRVEKLLNDRPRACLGFRTPAEVFFEKNPPSRCD